MCWVVVATVRKQHATAYGLLRMEQFYLMGSVHWIYYIYYCAVLCWCLMLSSMNLFIYYYDIVENMRIPVWLSTPYSVASSYVCFAFFVTNIKKWKTEGIADSSVHLHKMYYWTSLAIWPRHEALRLKKSTWNKEFNSIQMTCALFKENIVLIFQVNNMELRSRCWGSSG